jgi:hypothetical protein
LRIITNERFGGTAASRDSGKLKSAAIESEEQPPNQALHLTGAALLVSRDIKLLQRGRPRQVSLGVEAEKNSLSRIDVTVR